MKKTLLSSAILLALPTFAFASSTTLTDSVKLAPINVYSAYATPVNQDKTASSVTVLTEKDFAERNATYVLDVLKTVPSVSFIASGGRGTLSNIFLRGAEANHTAVIIDGVKMNPVSGNGVDFGGLSLSNVDRIEVLRGEQSALWGSDAMGGVIYITTKSGLYKDKPLNVDFDLGTGSHGTYDASATVSGYNNGFYYALHGDSHRTRGISAVSERKFNYTSLNGTPFSTGGATEKDRFHKDTASLRVGYDVGDKGIEFLTSRSSQTNAYDPSNINNEKRFDDRTRTNETLFKLSGYIGNEQDLFKHKFSISQHKADSQNLEETSTTTSEGKKRNANYQLDINFDSEGAITQALSLLAEYQKSYYSAQSGWAKFDNAQLSEKSIAAEYRLFSEDDHSLVVSGRYFDNSRTKNAAVGRISGAYRLSENLRAHASFGTAVQNPTMMEYYGWSGLFIGNPDLKPEKSKGGDLGLLLESNDKNHSLDITYFARNVENFISSKSQGMWPNQITQAINLEGTTKIKGVEVAYNGKLSDSLTAYANYTFTRAKNSNGIELARRPKHSANLGLAYQITDKLGSNASLSYVGKRIDTFPARTRMPAYTVVNFGVNYQLTDNLNLYANLNNAFNKKYENILGYGQFGRTVYVGLKGSF